MNRIIVAMSQQVMVRNNYSNFWGDSNNYLTHDGFGNSLSFFFHPLVPGRGGGGVEARYCHTIP